MRLLQTGENAMTTEDALIEQILDHCHTIAVVGFSTRPEKAGWYVPEYMQARGYRIIPVNPQIDAGLGNPAWPTLADIPEPVDVVNVFRRPEHVADVVREALAIGAKAIWVQLGITSAEGRALAQEAGVLYVEDRCMLAEHRRRRR
jgi:predicted CoA-binding protein